MGDLKDTAKSLRAGRTVGEVTISSEKLWVGIGTLVAVVAAGGIAVWHERDSRMEKDIDEIQANRTRILESYLELQSIREKKARSSGD